MTLPIKAGVGVVALRLVLGGIFLWAGVIKVLNPTEFLVAIYEYQTGLPETWLRVLAVTLPWIEVVGGLSILSGVWRETGLTLVALLLVSFLVATGQAWIRGLEITCGCFGGAGKGSSYWVGVQFAFLRNLMLLGAAGFLLARPSSAERDFSASRRTGANLSREFPISLE